MAVTFQSSGTIAVTASSTELAVTLPADIQANDIGLWHTHAQKSTLAHAYPAGWSVVGPVLNELVSSRTMGLSFAWRRFDGSTSGDLTVSHGGNSTCVLMSRISLWRGVTTNAGAPYSTQTSTTANSSMYDTEGMALADTDHMAVYLLSIADDQATFSTMSSAAGMADPLTAYNDTSALGNGCKLVMTYSQVTSSGTVQGGTERHGTVEVWSAFEIALRASTEAPTGYWTPTSFGVLGVQ